MIISAIFHIEITELGIFNLYPYQPPVTQQNTIPYQPLPPFWNGSKPLHVKKSVNARTRDERVRLGKIIKVTILIGLNQPSMLC